MSMQEMKTIDGGSWIGGIIMGLFLEIALSPQEHVQK